MKRGSLSNQGLPEVWVYGPDFYRVEKKEWWKFWCKSAVRLSSAKRDWLWKTGSRARLVLVWVGQVPDVVARHKDIDLFNELRPFESMAELEASLRAQTRVGEMIVESEHLLGPKAVLQNAEETRYNFRVNQVQRYQKWEAQE